ncbi:MAG: RNA 2'-phosphotransferase [Pseudomonadota bacterium]
MKDRSKSDLTRLSKCMSHALRHAPEAYGLSLDHGGWVELDALCQGIRQNRSSFTGIEIEDLLAAATSGSKVRHEIDGTRIRALYGHSAGQAIEKTRSETVPERLYHGTSETAWAAIRTEGLRSMRRQFVHLSETVDLARLTGRRKTPDPVILEIDAKRAADEGVAFYLGNDDIWLAEALPAGYIRLLS